MVQPLLFLTLLATMASASPAYLTQRSNQDDYPTNIGHPAYCKTNGICEYSQTPEANDACEAGSSPLRTDCGGQCTDTEKKTCQYYSCNVAWDQCQDDNSFESCSHALTLCEPVGGRPTSQERCDRLFVGYDGTVCEGCTLYGDNERCHISPEAYKQFSQGDRCRMSTDDCVSGQGCVSALLDCEYVGGPEISEEKCRHAVSGYEEENGRESDREVACSDCVSYANGRCLLDEQRFSEFQESHDLV